MQGARPTPAYGPRGTKAGVEEQVVNKGEDAEGENKKNVKKQGKSVLEWERPGGWKWHAWRARNAVACRMVGFATLFNRGYKDAPS